VQPRSQPARTRAALEVRQAAVAEEEERRLLAAAAAAAEEEEEEEEEAPQPKEAVQMGRKQGRPPLQELGARPLLRGALARRAKSAPSPRGA
jgi:hypothetical protein